MIGHVTLQNLDPQNQASIKNISFPATSAYCLLFVDLLFASVYPHSSLNLVLYPSYLAP